MYRLNIAPARSETEADEAFQLALGIFSGHIESADYPDIKASLWRDDPYYRPENLLLARAGTGRLVGLIRIVPRVLFRGDQSLRVAGFSSVCVHPEFRGQGYSAEMMRFAIEHCRTQRYDIALLIARRAADHYYTQFGFWGLSAFNRVMVAAGDGTRPGTPLQLAPWRPEHIGVYAAAYSRCYQATFGYFERSVSLWGYSLKKLHASGLADCRTIIVSDHPVGYVIHTRLLMHEVAWTGDLPFEALATAVRDTAQDTSATDRLSFDVSPAHLLLSTVAGADVTVSSRECHYGGHMVKILNVEKIAAALATRIQTKLGRLGVNDYASDRNGVVVEFRDRRCRVSVIPADERGPSFGQTCLLLGACSISSPAWDVDEPQPFNIALADQF